MLASGQLGRHHGLPVRIIVTARLPDLHARTGTAITGGGTHPTPPQAGDTPTKNSSKKPTTTRRSPRETLLLCDAVSGLVPRAGGAPNRIQMIMRNFDAFAAARASCEVDRK